MPLVVLGLNHRTAPVEVRERMVFDAATLPVALGELQTQDGIREALIVSTCNRTEMYCVADDAARLRHWLLTRHAAHGFEHCLYEHRDDDAVRHAFGVASGLDSLILGEPQILGQLKDAYRAAQEAAAAGPLLNRLFQATFTVAKRVRTETRIGASAVSVASAAVALARRVFAGFEQRTALLVGAGEMIELAARHLKTQGLGRLIIANRSIARAEELALEFRGSAIALDALDEHLPQADVIISSTASPVPVITADMMRRAIVARRRRPMFVVDIAVPRDVEPAVGELEDVYLYTIDDLRGVVDENLKSRQEEADAARRLIDEEVARFTASLRTQDAGPAIRELRARAETVRAQTLEQAERMLAAGRSPQEALAFLAATLTNRLMHGPSQALRQAAEAGDAEQLQSAMRLLRLDRPGD
jgi:glutamyl-tRNA reductase